MQEPDTELGTVFSVLNEIGIISQLSGALFQRRLPDGFLVSHFSVLNHLVRVGDGTTPLRIANAFQVPKTTMTHTLAGLEKAGLIRLAPNPEDGRSKCVFITEAGRRFRTNAISTLAPDVQTLAEEIPPARLAQILPILTELREYLDKERDKKGA